MLFVSLFCMNILDYIEVKSDSLIDSIDLYESVSV